MRNRELDKQKPHVLILITRANLGGAQMHVLDLIKGLSEQFRFTLACGEDDYLTKQAKQQGIEVVILEQFVRPISFIKDYLAYRAIRKLIREIQPDLIHLHSSKAGVLGRFAAHIEKTPSLFTAHGWAFTEGTGRFQSLYGLWIERFMGRYADGVIAVSQYDYALAKQHDIVDLDRLWCVQNAIEDRQPAQLKNTSRKITQIVTVGRIGKQKNHALLLKALTQVDRPYRATIVGDGPLTEDIKTLIDELNLKENVIVLGETSHVTPILEQSDIFVLSSLYEGLPLTILEAMRTPIAVIATDVGGVSELVDDQLTGYLIPSQNAQILASKIAYLIDNPSVRDEMANAAKKRFQTHFSLEKMIEKNAEIYKRLIS